MNPRIGPTRRPAATWRALADGIAVVGPNAGEMAGARRKRHGRMAEPLEIAAAAEALLAPARGPLTGKRVLITSGPDPRGDRPGALHRQPILGKQVTPSRAPRGGPAPR